MALTGKKNGGTSRPAGTPAPRSGLGKKLNPQTRGYRFRDQGRPATAIAPDDLTIAPQYRSSVALIRPKWDSATPTIFRPFPMFNAETPGEREAPIFDPYRFSLAPFDFGDHLRAYPAAKYIGKDEKFTFLMHVKGDPDGKIHPYRVLYNALYNAFKAGTLPTAKWNPLIQGTNKVLEAPQDLTFLQGALFRHRNDVYGLADKPPVGFANSDLLQVLQLPKSAGAGLMAALNAVREDYDGDTEGDVDWEAAMVNGDPFSLDRGRFIRIINPEKAGGAVSQVNVPTDDDEEVEMDLAADAGPVSQGGQAHDGQPQRGYAVELDTHYHIPGTGKKMSARLDKYAAKVGNKLIWWNELLYVPGLDETLELLARAFRSLPKMLEFGWQDHPEYLTPAVRGILRNRTQGPGAEVPPAEDEVPEENDDIQLDLEDDEDAPLTRAQRDRRRTQASALDDAADDAVEEEEAEADVEEDVEEEALGEDDENVVEEELGEVEESEEDEEIPVEDEAVEEGTEDVDLGDDVELGEEEQDGYEDDPVDDTPAEEEADDSDAQARMEEALAAANRKAAQRPAPSPTRTPNPATAKAGTKPATKPAAAPGKPATAAAKPGTKPATTAAKPAVAKPATSKPATAAAATAGKKPAGKAAPRK